MNNKEFIFGVSSEKQLATVCHEMELTLRYALSLGVFDISVIEGYRDQYKQDGYFYSGKSKVMFPDSDHNQYPSKAADVYPYPNNDDDLGRKYMFAGFIIACGAHLGYDIGYGGDWDGDKNTVDQKFIDLPHFWYRGPLKN